MSFCFTSAVPATPTPPRNAIFITVDALRADVLGYAQGPARTPQLDALAHASWNFTQCMAASMLSNPSHASLMTSLYPRDHHVYDNEHAVNRRLPVLAEALQMAGWHTAAVFASAERQPQHAGLGRGLHKVSAPDTLERSAAYVTTEALRLIDDLPQPFFLWIHYSDPHAPYIPDLQGHANAGAWPLRADLQEARRYAPPFQRRHAWFQQVTQQSGDTQALRDAYVAEVERLDSAIGSLREGLQQRHLQEHTVLSFTATHGENLGEKQLFFHHGGLYDTTVHVPWLLYTPHSQVPAQHVARLVSHVDIAPSLLAALGLPPTTLHTPQRTAKHLWQGMDMWSMAAAPQTLAASRPVFSEHMLGQLTAVRSPAGTLIAHRQSSHQLPAYPFHQGKQEVFPKHLSSQDRTHLQNALKQFLRP